MYDLRSIKLMRLPDLSLMMMTFRLQADAPVVLPPFLGSTLRGAFGKALKQVVCFVPHGDCERCWFREVCAYQYIFESPHPANVPREEMHPKLRGHKNVPPPFVLIPPRLVKKLNTPPGNQTIVKNLNEDYHPQSFSRGDLIEFSIILIGRAVRHWAHILVAVRRLAENGLGESNVPFSLIEAFAHDSAGKPLCVFNRENPRISARGVSAAKLSEIVSLRVQQLADDLKKRSENVLRIEFLSPISSRILLEGEPDLSLEFSDLLKKITERLEFLSFLHGEPPEKIDYRPLLLKINYVRTIRKSLTRYRFEQRSSRQERVIPRAVFLGEIFYKGEKLKEFLPYLFAGEMLNVGSNTSVGLGRFMIQL